MHPDIAVADRIGRPLYRFQAGELHATVYFIGDHLADAFDLAIEWKGILVLDGRSCSTRTELKSRKSGGRCAPRQKFTP